MHFVPEVSEKTDQFSVKKTQHEDMFDEKSSLYWNTRAQFRLREQLTKEPNKNVAKNVIFFLGDGMSIPTITAARIYSGQLEGFNGEESRLSFEKFPYTSLSKVRAKNHSSRIAF